MTDEAPVELNQGPGLTPGPRLAVLCAVMCLLLFLPLGGTSSFLNLAFGLWFTEIFVFFGVAWELTRLSGRNPARYSGLGHFDGVAVALGALFGLLNFVGVVAPLQLLAKTYLEPLVPRFLQGDMRHLFEGISPLELGLVLGAVGLAAPVAEEFAFRGVIQNGMADGEKPERALWITAVLFSAFHFDLVGFPARFELGLLFGLLFMSTRSVWPGIAAHAANNLVSSGLFLASRLEKTTEESAPPTLGVLTFGIGGMTAMVMLWRWLSPTLHRRAAPVLPVALENRPRSLWPAMLRWGGAAVFSMALVWWWVRRSGSSSP